MDRFFDARSVAVVGVSKSPTNLGRAMVFNLMEFGYQGVIYLVGVKGGAFLGHPIYPSVSELPQTVDLAALLVPATTVPGILEECGRRGIRRVVVESAGFRELGDDRRELEDRIRSILDRYQMRMIGPNCIGIINRKSGLAVPFMPMKAEAPLGRVAIISQSGGVGAMVINSLAAEHMGFSKFASIGNKLDVDENDLLDYFTRVDEDTDLVFCYLEGIADGRRLMEAARRSPKPVVVHKSNHGGSGAIIARSHSASLAVNDRVVDAAFRQAGIIRVREQREALEVLKAMQLPAMRGARLAVISRSGGHAVMAADSADEYGFRLPPFPEPMLETVREHARAKVIQFHNPLDLGDVFDLDLYHQLAEENLARDDLDGLLFIHNYQGIFDAQESRRLIKSFGALMAKYRKPIAVCVFTMQGELQINREAVDYPLFTDPREAVRALARNREYYSVEGKPIAWASRRPEGVDPERAASLLDGLEPGPVPAAVLASILTAYGVPLVAWKMAQSEEEAAARAAELGYPVVLKTAQIEVVHKSEAGGVRLDLGDERAVRQAYREMARLGTSVLVQKMATGGMEWIVGGRRDPQFGPVIIAGLGGIYVEIFAETEIRIGPLTPGEASRMISQCRGSRLLSGLRGAPPLARALLEATVVRVSWLLADHPCLAELDLNPVRVAESDALALDWRATKGSP